MPHGGTGFLVRYRVETTEHKGLGVFARDPIRKGTIVWRHRPGIFIVYDEPAFRAKIATMPPEQVVYELTHVHALEDFPGCLIRALDDGILINHSGDPTLVTDNAAPLPQRLDPAAPGYLQRVHEALTDDRYSLIATRDIAPGEELTNDYNAEDACPPFYDALYTRYGVREEILDND